MFGWEIASVKVKKKTEENKSVWRLIFLILGVFLVLCIGFCVFSFCSKRNVIRPIEKSWTSMKYSRGKISLSLNMPRNRKDNLLMKSDDLRFYLRKDGKSYQFSAEGQILMQDGNKEEKNRVSLRCSNQDGCVRLNDTTWSSVKFSEDFYLTNFYRLSKQASAWKKEDCKKRVNGCKAYCLKGVISDVQKSTGKDLVESFFRSFVPDCVSLQDMESDNLSFVWYFQKGSDRLLAVSLTDENQLFTYRMDFDLFNRDLNSDVFILYDNYSVDDTVYRSPFDCFYSFFGMTNDFSVSGDWKCSYQTDDMIGDIMTVREGKKEIYYVGFRGYRSLQSVKLEEDPVYLSVSGNDSTLYSYAYLADKVGLNLHDTVYADHQAAMDYYKNREKAGDIRGRKISKIESFVIDGNPVYTYSYEYIYSNADSRKEFCQDCYLYYVGLGNTYVVITVESQTDAGTSVLLNSSLARDVFYSYSFTPVQ